MCMSSLYVFLVRSEPMVSWWEFTLPFGPDKRIAERGKNLGVGRFVNVEQLTRRKLLLEQLADLLVSGRPSLGSDFPSSLPPPKNAHTRSHTL